MIRIPQPAKKGPIKHAFNIPSRGISGGLRTNKNGLKLFHIDFSDCDSVTDAEILQGFRRINDRVHGISFTGNIAAGVLYPPTNYRFGKNGRSVLKFGNPGGLTSIATVPTTSICGQASGTWFFVFVQGRSSASNGALFSTAQSIGATGFSVFFDSNFDGNLIVDWGDSALGGRATIPIGNGINRATWGVWAVRRNNNVIAAYRNGVFVGSAEVTSAINQGNTSKLSIGNATPDAALSVVNFNGYIAEIISYKNSFTENEIIIESKELQAKWDVQDRTVVYTGSSLHVDAHNLDGMTHGTNVTQVHNCGGFQNVNGIFTFVSGVSSGMQFSKVAGIPGISFNGTGYLSTTGSIDIITAGTDYGMLLVTTPFTQVDAFSNIYDWDHGNGTPSNFVLQRNNTANTWNFSHYDTVGGTSYPVTSPTFPIGQRMVAGAMKNGTDLYFNINNASTTTAVCPAGLGNASKQFRLAGNVSFTRRYAGIIHELVMFDATISQATMQEYIATMMRKWKV